MPVTDHTATTMTDALCHQHCTAAYVQLEGGLVKRKSQQQSHWCDVRGPPVLEGSAQLSSLFWMCSDNPNEKLCLPGTITLMCHAVDRW